MKNNLPDTVAMPTTNLEIVKEKLKFARGKLTEALYEMGRQEGRCDVYEEMEEQLDTNICCPDCGYQYKTRKYTYSDTKAVHDTECKKRKARLAVTRDAYFAEFMAEQKQKESLKESGMENRT